MVVDFLEQLSAALPSTEEEVKDVLRGKHKNPKKLELRLIDRKKLSNDGYAVPQLHPPVISCGQGFRHSHTVFPEGSSCEHYTLW